MRDRAAPPIPGPSEPQRAALFQRFMPGIDHRTTGEILAHPDFAAMRRRYVETTTECYRVAVFPGAMQSTAYRTAAIGALMCLDAAYVEADRATWPTLARFKQSTAIFGLSSARQIDDFVARLVETGNVVLERPAADGRLRLLRPQEKLRAWDRDVLAAYFGVLQSLYPATDYGLPNARDPAFQAAQRRASIQTFPLITTFLRRNADLMPFHGMYQGTRLLMILADRKAHHPEAPVRERDFAALTREFRVSRSHIRNILVAAEAAGLLTGSGSDRKNLEPTPRGLAAVDRYIADTLASHDLTYHLALAELGRPAQPRT